MRKSGSRAARRYLLAMLVVSSMTGCRAPMPEGRVAVDSSGRETVAAREQGGVPIPSSLSLHDSLDSETSPKSSADTAIMTVGHVTGLQSVDVEPAALQSSTPMPESEPVPRDDSGLTLQDLEAMAMSSHPAIEEARAQVAAAQGQVTQAGLPPNPVLQYQSQEVGVGDASGLHSVAISQTYVTANKLGLAQQVNAQRVAERRAALRQTELQIRSRLRIAFVNALVAQRRAELTERINRIAEASLDSARQLYQAQEISKVNVLQAEVEAQQARINSENAQSNLQAARRTVAAAAGVDSLPGGGLAGDLRNWLIEQPWQPLLEEITALSPEVDSANASLQRARWALQLACAQVTPNVTAQVGVGFDAGSDDTFAQVGVSVPLPLRNRNQGNIRSARAQIAANAASIERVELDLETRLAGAVARYQTARQRLNRLEEEVLPAAEEMFELAKAAFEAGESSYLSLLTSQRTLIDTELRRLDAMQQAQQAAAEIDGLLVTLDIGG